jgi:hypothetical protein
MKMHPKARTTSEIGVTYAATAITRFTSPIGEVDVIASLAGVSGINFARLKWNRRNQARKPSLCGEEDLLRRVPTWAWNL